MADILCASSTMTRSQSTSHALSRMPSLLRARHVEAGQPQAAAGEGVALVQDLVASEDVELKPNFSRISSCHWSTRRTGRDHHDVGGVAAQEQLLDEEAGHDRLAGTGIIGEDVAQRLLVQHALVDRTELVRQRLHITGAERGLGIEQVGKAHAPRLGRQQEGVRVGIEAERQPRLDRTRWRIMSANTIRSAGPDAVRYVTFAESSVSRSTR